MPQVNEDNRQPHGQQVWTLPTLLTVCRVLAIPILIAVWFSQSHSASQICCGIFLTASFTDFLDGYLARKMGLTSNFGAFLDPVADKLMVAAVLILLSSRPLTTGPLTGNTWILPVISSVIIGREIAMSALRELAASLGGDAYSAVAVSSWGKWKTATQMASLTLMLLTAGGNDNLHDKQRC
ncbi:g7207 [Coccomyxa elongata]